MRYAGKKGFNSIGQKARPERALNLRQLSGVMEKLANQKELQMENNIPVVDLQSLGYTKLLGGGSISQPIRVKVGSCSESALRKLKEAGGDAVLSKTSES